MMTMVVDNTLVPMLAVASVSGLAYCTHSLSNNIMEAVPLKAIAAGIYTLDKPQNVAGGTKTSS